MAESLTLKWGFVKGQSPLKSQEICAVISLTAFHCQQMADKPTEERREVLCEPIDQFTGTERLGRRYEQGRRQEQPFEYGPQSSPIGTWSNLPCARGWNQWDESAGGRTGYDDRTEKSSPTAEGRPLQTMQMEA